MATCYRHPDRETGVSCSNCERPICPDCMTPTSVGMRCPECAKQKTKVRTVNAPSLGAALQVTRALIAINVVAFVAEIAATKSGNPGGTVYEHGALLGSGLLGHSDGSVVEAGVGHGEWWRLITSGFLHDPRMPGGLLHIGFNMYLLYVLGQMLEPALGRAKFLAVYLVGLLGGSFGALLLSPDAFTVGASGAVFGLMGAAFIELRRRGVDPFQSGIGGLIVINLIFSFTFSGISIGGHLGGLAGGALAALALQVGDKRRSAPIGLAACAALALVAAVAAVVAGNASVGG